MSRVTFGGSRSPPPFSTPFLTVIIDSRKVPAAASCRKPRRKNLCRPERCFCILNAPSGGRLGKQPEVNRQKLQCTGCRRQRGKQDAHQAAQPEIYTRAVRPALDLMKISAHRQQPLTAHQLANQTRTAVLGTCHYSRYFHEVKGK